MKANLLDINGKKLKEITLPSCFSEKIREDIVAKVLEAKKTKQPYGPSPVAGKQNSASGNIQHTRSVWKTMQGKGISRVPRKIMSRRGSQFNWVGAEIPNARGGRRAHPPKVDSMINTKKINKKELEIALKSALAATVIAKMINEKYQTLNDKKIENLPLIVEDKFLGLKTKQQIQSLGNILGKDLIEVALKRKKVRSGIGKLRGRKYKENAGLLLVIGEKEKTKINAIEIKKVKELSVTDLAKGGLGRLTLYTEKALEDLNNKFKGEKKE